jgi:small redox-active disulfide protein 2
MKIEVLGPGCQRCELLARNTQTAVARSGREAVVEKVSDIAKMVEYGILATPGLVIDGKVVCTGRVPAPEEIKGWIESAG